MANVREAFSTEIVYIFHPHARSSGSQHKFSRRASNRERHRIAKDTSIQPLSVGDAIHKPNRTAFLVSIHRTGCSPNSHPQPTKRSTLHTSNQGRLGSLSFADSILTRQISLRSFLAITPQFRFKHKRFMTNPEPQHTRTASNSSEVQDRFGSDRLRSRR